MDLKQTCCMCAGIAYPGVSLLDVAQQNLVHWIRENLVIKILEDDRIPTKVCKPCSEQIKRWVMFKERCINIHKNFSTSSQNTVRVSSISSSCNINLKSTATSSVSLEDNTPQISNKTEESNRTENNMIKITPKSPQDSMKTINILRQLRISKNKLLHSTKTVPENVNNNTIEKNTKYNNLKEVIIKVEKISEKDAHKVINKYNNLNAPVTNKIIENRQDCPKNLQYKNSQEEKIENSSNDKKSLQIKSDRLKNSKKSPEELANEIEAMLELEEQIIIPSNIQILQSKIINNLQKRFKRKKHIDNNLEEKNKIRKLDETQLKCEKQRNIQRLRSSLIEQLQRRHTRNKSQKIKDIVPNYELKSSNKIHIKCQVPNEQEPNISTSTTESISHNYGPLVMVPLVTTSIGPQSIDIMNEDSNLSDTSTIEFDNDIVELSIPTKGRTTCTTEVKNEYMNTLPSSSQQAITYNRNSEDTGYSTNFFWTNYDRS